MSNLLLVVISYILGRKYYAVPYRLGRAGEYILIGVVAVAIILWGYDSIATTWIRLIVNTLILLVLAGYTIWREHLLASLAPVLRRLQHKTN